ncbi:MAG: hypothetical protein RL885_05520 [Planctomycetota bacterium]
MTPLNWPVGTIRTLAVLTLATLVGVQLAKAQDVSPVVGGLTILVIGYYFGYRSATGGESPFRLPSGSIRFALTALAAFLAYRRYEAGDLFELGEPLGALFLLVLSFLAGNAWRAMMKVLLRGGGGTPAGLGNHAKGVAMIGSLTALVLFAVLGEDAFERFTPEQIQSVLAAIIGFYFGSRSSG